MARTHVLISDEVLRAIDDQVGERGRSRFIEAAAREKLERLELERALKESSGIFSPADYPDWPDRASVHAWVRNVRDTEEHGPRTR